MAKMIKMGFNYSDGTTLVRTVCRAFTADKQSMIAYTEIAAGGYASDIYLLPEEDFRSRFGI